MKHTTLMAKNQECKDENLIESLAEKKRKKKPNIK